MAVLHLAAPDKLWEMTMLAEKVAAKATTADLKITPLAGSLGAKVEGIDLADVDDELFAAIHEAWLEHLVLVFPKQQHLTPAQQAAFALRWGEVHVMPTPDVYLEGTNAVIELDFHGRKPPTDKWHSDVTMDALPPKATFLLGRTIPIGGDTMFANQYLAYERLSDGMKKLLDGLKLIHDGETFARSGGYETSRFPTSVHPIVRTHPETGRKALFVNSTYGRYIEGMTAEESAPILNYLYQHCVHPNITFRHRWTEGDLLMWDNRAVMHFAIADYGAQRRTMHRVTILGEKPV